MLNNEITFVGRGRHFGGACRCRFEESLEGYVIKNRFYAARKCVDWQNFQESDENRLWQLLDGALSGHVASTNTNKHGNRGANNRTWWSLLFVCRVTGSIPAEVGGFLRAREDPQVHLPSVVDCEMKLLWLRVVHTMSPGRQGTLSV